MKGKAPQRHAETSDPGLDAAFAAMRKRCLHVPHGRVMLLVQRDENMTFAHQIGADPDTTDDIAKAMTERPHKSEVSR